MMRCGSARSYGPDNDTFILHLFKEFVNLMGNICFVRDKRRSGDPEEGGRKPRCYVYGQKR